VSQPAKKFRHLPLTITLVVIALAGFGLLKLVMGWLAESPQASKPVAQEIRIIRPPPPPPPKEEPPPPPPPEEEVDVPEPTDEPEPTPSDEPPPGEQLGLDADGTAGGDGFGLVARKGGRDLLSSGGSAFNWYAGLVKNEVLDLLDDDVAIRRGAYSVSVRIWVRPDGSIERALLAQSTGNADRDRAIETALSRMQRLSQAPPGDMPQPITLRIVSRA
jgi:periplasmic protein TonB